LIESYILILSAVILSVGNFALWWLLFDDEFKQRMEIYEEAFREQMKKENEKFVNTLQPIIELDPEAAEIAGFGDQWRENLQDVSKLREEAQDMRRRTIWVYYFALGTILFASGGLLAPNGIQITSEFTLYITAISWWVLVSGVLAMVGLLVHFQLIENRSIPRTEGEAISDDSAIGSVLGGLRKKLPV
jgi:hypothetical protein